MWEHLHVARVWVFNEYEATVTITVVYCLALAIFALLYLLSLVRGFSAQLRSGLCGFEKIHAGLGKLACLRFARAASLLVLRLAARRRWEELIQYPYLLPVANVISASWVRTSRACRRTVVLPDGQEAVPYLPRVCRLRWRSARCQMGFAFVMAFRSAYGSLLRARRWWVLCRWFPLASANCYIVVSIVLVWKRKAPMRANNCSAKFFVFGWRIARSRWLAKTTKNSCSGLRRLSWAWTRIAPGR